MQRIHSAACDWAPNCCVPCPKALSSMYIMTSACSGGHRRFAGAVTPLPIFSLCLPRVSHSAMPPTLHMHGAVHRGVCERTVEFQQIVTSRRRGAAPAAARPPARRSDFAAAAATIGGDLHQTAG